MNNNGYIIIGFPGVGKSTVAKDDTRFIDLESSTFMVDGQRSEDWYKIYVNVAIDLAKQYNVFISSHMAVQNYLATLNYNNVIMVYPDKSLKTVLLKRLSKRYESDPSDKNKRALDYMESNFDTCVDDMDKSNNFMKLRLNSIKQADDLHDLILYVIDKINTVRREDEVRMKYFGPEKNMVNTDAFIKP